MSETLVDPSRRFITTVTASLRVVSQGVAGVQADQLEQDVALEAFNLSCGLIAIDRRVSDDELWELIHAYGPRLQTQIAGATPDALRRSGLLERQLGFVAQPSAMFEVLLAADAKGGSTYARGYYAAALEIAFAVAAIDLHTTDGELAAIEAFRTMLLGEIEAMEAKRTPAATASAGTAATKVAATATKAEDDPPARPLDELLKELDAVIGLDGVKHEVKLVTNLLRVQKIREQRGLPVSEQSRHLIFTGNPGTGKTTVARLLAQIYRTLGVVTRGHLVETDRSGLVAGFVGQTAPLVTAKFDEADEGVLLIDEAYSLVRGGERDFGREAIDAIVKLIEDRRDRIVVIMCGYPEEMGELIESNPGLRSRFPKSISFPDYTTDELLLIIGTLGDTGRYHLSDGAAARARAWLDAIPRDKGFGNGRTARNLFEYAVASQATRLASVADPTDDQLTTLEPSDIPDPGQGPLTVSGPAPGTV